MFNTARSTQLVAWTFHFQFAIKFFFKIKLPLWGSPGLPGRRSRFLRVGHRDWLSSDPFWSSFQVRVAINPNGCRSWWLTSNSAWPIQPLIIFQKITKRSIIILLWSTDLVGVGWELGDERVVEQETGEGSPLEIFDETCCDEVVELTAPICWLVQLRRRIARNLPATQRQQQQQQQQQQCQLWM